MRVDLSLATFTGGQPNQPTVFVVDDDPAVRRSLRWLLESADFCVATFSGAQSFLDTYDSSRPGCLVLDLRMPGIGGLELQARLARQPIQLPIVVITAHGNIDAAIRAFKAGIVDLLEKPFDDERLIASIQLGLELDQGRRAGEFQRKRHRAQLESLRPREREVLRAIALGKPNKSIARDLRLTVKAIEYHRARLMHKLKVRSFAELMRLVLAFEALQQEAYPGCESGPPSIGSKPSHAPAVGSGPRSNSF